VRNVGAGQPYITIAAALSASSDGDVINLVDPVYTEADLDVSVAVTIQGKGASATIVQAYMIYGMASSRVFSVASSGRVVIRDLTIRHGNETGSVGIEGGGIYLSSGGLLLDGVIVTLNRVAGDPGMSVNGGGISVGAGFLRIRDSTITNNLAEGGVMGPQGTGGCAYGGGISVSSSEVTEIVNTTISSNQALGGNGVFQGLSCAHGGGIRQSSGTLRLVNSVIRDNQAIGGSVSSGFGGPAEGGGVHGGAFAAVHIVNSTVSSNRAQAGTGTSGSQAFGGGIKLRVGSLTSSTVATNETLDGTIMYAGGLYSDAPPGEGPLIASSVLADNLCSHDATAADLKGHVVSADYNIVEKSGGTFTGATSHDQIGVDPLLLALGDSGGPTWTHPLGAGSPGIDMVPVGASGCSAGGFDQRGYHRANGVSAGGTSCDCGAFETGSSDAGLVFFDFFETADTWNWSAAVP
jgi:hypothetical protein